MPRRPRPDAPSPWDLEDRLVREESVWLARLVSQLLAGGWNTFWLAVACVLLGVVGHHVYRARHAPPPRLPTPAVSAPVAPVVPPVVVVAPPSPDLAALREEVAALRAAQARDAERARDADEARRRAEDERDRAREALARATAAPPVSVAPTLVVQVPAPVVVAAPRPLDLNALLAQAMYDRLRVVLADAGAARETTPEE